MPAATRDIQRRLRSVRNTHKITKAMELVASAKMRKASQAVMATRPYANEAWTMVKNLRQRTDSDQHPLLQSRPEIKRTGLVLLATNRGLVGGLNSNLIAAAHRQISGPTGQTENAEVLIMGAKGRMIRSYGHDITAEFTKEDVVTSSLVIRPLANLVMEKFLDGTYDRVMIAFMDYRSMMIQKPVVRQLLPIGDDELAVLAGGTAAAPTEYLFEPSMDTVLEFVLPRLVEIQLYRALLETNASEQAARMMAMRNASDAAEELIDDLALTFNQARQASITQDLAEISAGRAALE